MARPLRFLLASAVIAFAAITATAQDRVMSPPELYCGDNYVTITLPSGIKRIEIASASSNVLVFGAGLVDCRNEYKLRVNVTDPGAAQLKLAITDCHNRVVVRDLLSRSWNVDVNRMGHVDVGHTACHEFQIRATGSLGGTLGAAFYVDSITVDDKRISLDLPGGVPVMVRPGETYNYRVCFKADRPGNFKFPVTTWIRRDYPSGGLTTYAVADTGLLIVDRPKEPVQPIDTARSVPVVIEEEPPLTDPTTFRTVVVPNAVMLPAKRFYAGSYDLLGLTAGYGVTDNIMIIAGGAPPTPDDWGGIHGDMFDAFSIGAKAGLKLTSDLQIAAGLQWGRSFYDKEHPLADTVRSTINVTAPYLALSYGDDDSRLSLTAGYAFKHHIKPSVEFDQNAMIIALGGDYRFARHWKIAGEMVSMETLGLLPLLGTVRYFDDSFAIDAGIVYAGITKGDTKAPAVQVVPLVSAVFVF